MSLIDNLATFVVPKNFAVKDTLEYLSNVDRADRKKILEYCVASYVGYTVSKWVWTHMRKRWLLRNVVGITDEYKFGNKWYGVHRMPAEVVADPLLARAKFEKKRFKELRKQGHSVLVQWMTPTVPFVCLITTEAASVILKSQVELKKNVIWTILRPWLGHGLVSSHGDLWRRQRKMITPSFHFNILEDCEAIVQENSEILLEMIEIKASKSEIVTIYPMLKRMALDIIMESAMGMVSRTQQAEDDTIGDAIDYILGQTIPRIVNPLLHAQFIYDMTEKGKKVKKATNLLHSYSGKLLETRLEEKITGNAGSTFGSSKHKVFLDCLLDHYLDGKMTKQNLIDEVQTFVFAGSDTSSTTLQYLLLLLGQHMDIQQQLYEELLEKTLLGNPTATFSNADAQKSALLDAVIKEGMRYHSPVHNIGRTLINDVKIDDVTIPAGTNLRINLIALHEDPEIWGADVGEFKPSRFLEKELPNPYAFLGFSAGPRNCIGQRFAMMEMRLVLVDILRSYKVVAVPGQEDLFSYSTGLATPEAPIKLMFEKRVYE